MKLVVSVMIFVFDKIRPSEQSKRLKQKGRYLPLPSLEARNSNTKVGVTGLISGDRCLPGCAWRPSWCVLMPCFLSVCVYAHARVPACAQEQMRGMKGDQGKEERKRKRKGRGEEDRGGEGWEGQRWQGERRKKKPSSFTFLLK